jgi:hypothetical protein
MAGVSSPEFRQIRQIVHDYVIALNKCGVVRDAFGCTLIDIDILIAFDLPKFFAFVIVI